MKDAALRTAGVIFLLVALVHFARLLGKVQITVAGHEVSLRLSVFGFIAALSFAVLMFVASGKKGDGA